VPPKPWKALTAAWLGWAFDGLDGYLYIMVAMPFVKTLLAKEAKIDVSEVAQDDVIAKAAIIQAVFLVGWAVGGAVFGRVGDRLGRTRTLTLTILTYAIFTGMAFFAQAWWHLLIFRFLAALGIGGEWAAGSALVSETLHKKHRAWASATLQSGYMIGCIMAALTSGWMGGIDHKWVFVVGVVPALLVMWIRSAVPETEEWKNAAKHTAPPPVSSLFSSELRRTTLVLIALTGVALTTVWSFLYFVPQAVRAMPEVKDWAPKDVAALVTRVTIAYFLINIVGNYFATYLARFCGYRAAFTMLFAASMASYLWMFKDPLTLDTVYVRTLVPAFFSLGLFGLFPLYVPPLFPTLVRTLGSGFTYNAGRLISAAGTMAGGTIVAQAGGQHKAIFWVGLLFIPGILVALFCPVPRDNVPKDTESENA
jgi:MFS family permease